MKTQLSDTEASCYGAKWGDRHEGGLGIRHVKFNALYYFGKSEVTRSVVSDVVLPTRITSRPIGVRSTH